MTLGKGYIQRLYTMFATFLNVWNYFKIELNTYTQKLRQGNKNVCMGIKEKNHMQVIPKLISRETNFWSSSNYSFNCREIWRNVAKYYSLGVFLNNRSALNNLKKVKLKHQMELDIALKYVENYNDKAL